MHSACHGRIWTHMPSHQQPSWAKWWRICRTPPCKRISLIARGLPNMPWFLGSSGHVQPNPTESAQSVDTALQSNPSQKSDKSKSPCISHRAYAIKEQGSSGAVVCKRGGGGGGGGNFSIAPDNRLLITNHGLKGFLTSRLTQAWGKFC